MVVPDTLDVRPFRPRYPGELVVRIARDLLDGLSALDAVGGDAVTAYGRAGRLLFLRHPDLIRAVLIDRNADVAKARGLRLARQLLCEGLLTSEPPLHTRQRRLVLPAFHQRRLRAYAADMVRLAHVEAGAWRPGEAIAVDAAMSRLTLAVAGRTLFGADVLGDADTVGRALDEAMDAFDRAQHPFSEWLQRLPLPNTRKTRRARATLDALVYRLIAEYRAEGPSALGHDRGTLLALLLAARDEDTGEAMTDEQVRDEATTLLLAGHETTADALAWTWAFLAEEPEVEARFHAELDAALGGRPPTFDDLPALPYTRQVFAEALRLRPPAWVVGRETIRDTDLDGLAVPARTTVLFGPLFLHRDPRFWPEPGRFDPERFAPEGRAQRHKFAYLPFSAGRRGCIGEQFAWTEGVLVLAALGQRWRLRAAGPMPPPHGSVTLRPRTPIRLVPEARG